MTEQVKDDRRARRQGQMAALEGQAYLQSMLGQLGGYGDAYKNAVQGRPYPGLVPESRLGPPQPQIKAMPPYRKCGISWCDKSAGVATFCPTCAGNLESWGVAV